MNSRLLCDVVEINSLTECKYPAVEHEGLVFWQCAVLLIELETHAFDCFFRLNIECDRFTGENALDKDLESFRSFRELCRLVDVIREVGDQSGWGFEIKVNSGFILN
jgi:hypothetical protein